MIGRAKDPLGVERVFNWYPSLPTRQPHYAPDTTLKLTQPLPFLDLRSKMPPVTDQGNEGACTGHSSVAGLYVAQVNAGRKHVVMPAPAFIYYNERLMNGQENEDAGAAISDIYRAANHYGVCDESLFPYIAGRYTVKPSANVYAAAVGIKAHIYAPVPQILENITGCIHHGGFPVNFGFTVYESFMSDAVAKTGVVPMPGPNEMVDGGHAVSIVGYNVGPYANGNVPPKHFIVRNSWGTAWGDNGYFYMPFAYVLDPQLADDFWMIRSI